MHTCPGCGLSGYEDRFDEPLAPNVADLVTRCFGAEARAGGLSAPQRYSIAAAIAVWNKASSREIADLYLKAAWCCDAGEDVGPDDDERFFRREATKLYERALDAGEIGEDEAVVHWYLVGELYRRVGDVTAAMDWFNRVIDLAEEDPGHVAIAALARRQKTAPQDMM